MMNVCVHGIRAQVRILAVSMALLVLTACSVRDSLLSLSPAMLPTLSGLTLSAGTLNPSFAAHLTRYTTMIIDTPSITVTPTAGPGTTITVNGTSVVSGTTSGPITLPTGHRTITVAVTSSSGTAIYTITAHRLAHETYIKASNTEINDQFGYSVALDNDTLAVGAPFEFSNGKGGGAVYVFTRHSGMWHQQASIKASNTEGSDQFGYSVALDGNTLAVGAIGESSNGQGVDSDTQSDNSLPFAGAAYVFTRRSGVWQQQAYIKASNTEGGDFFGFNVALDRDTLAVGAPSQGRGDNSPYQSGAVYVFTRHGSTWQQQAYVKASNPGANDNFGWSVGLDGHTLAVGAVGESSNGRGVNSGAEGDDSALFSGAVYVFTRHGSTWQQQAYVKASNTDANDEFGFSVALDDDMLAVGAYGESSNGRGVNSGAGADNSESASGAVYIFTRHGHTWHQQAYIKSSNSVAGDAFGWSVALSHHTLAVGANQSVGEPSPGAVYLFTQSGGAWYEQAFVNASNAEKLDLFGNSVALSGNTLVIGAPREDSNGRGVNSGAGADNSAFDSGAVYVGCVVRIHSQHQPATVHSSEERCER